MCFTLTFITMVDWVLKNKFLPFFLPSYYATKKKLKKSFWYWQVDDNKKACLYGWQGCQPTGEYFHQHGKLWEKAYEEILLS